MMKHLFIILICVTAGLFPQEKDISKYLTYIEFGEIKSAEEGLLELKASDPDDPAVIYLDAVLTDDGKTALGMYEKIVDSYPKSRYADDALYRMYSYYYAVGLYNTAEKYNDKLKKDYPSSPYLTEKTAELKEEVAVKEEVPALKEPVSKKEKSKAEKVYKYTIQTGAFLIRKNAVNLKETFQKAGYFSEIKEKKVGGSTFSIVYLGRFQTEEEAMNFFTDLNKRQNIEGTVVEME